MKYFRIARNGVRTTEPCVELSKDEFDVIISDQALFNLGGEPPFDFDDLTDDEVDEKLNDLCEQYEEEAKSEYGICIGDYDFYIRDDDAGRFDFTRRN